MRFRRQFAGLLALLIVFAMLIVLNLPKAQMARATVTPWHQPAKDSMSILPKKLPSQMRIPGNTVSIYESSTNPVMLYNQGCSAAHRSPGLLILDWGEPVYYGNNTFGTYDFGGHHDTDTAIMHAVANFAQGVWYCRTSYTNIAIGIGTSNYYSGNSMPFNTSLWYAAGQQWGRLVNNVQSFINANHYSVVGANGASDMEVEWANFTLTSSMVNGYNNVTSHAFFDFGDDSPGWWSYYQVWYIAYGARDNFPLPEIYYNGDATLDWEPLSVWACRYEGGPIYFKGIMAEAVAGTYSPAQAFSVMYNAEASNSCTARDLPGMIFSTEIYHTS